MEIYYCKYVLYSWRSLSLIEAMLQHIVRSTCATPKVKVPSQWFKLVIYGSACTEVGII